MSYMAGQESERDSAEPTAFIRLLVVEDHDMVREALVTALAPRPSVKVVAATASLSDARQALASHKFDVIITDLRLADGRGTELVALAKTLDPSPAVLLVTGTENRAGVTEALAAGCAGFISKTEGFAQLIEAIQIVARGGSVFPADLLLSSVTGDLESVGASLSDREREVLQLLATAHSARDIAGLLFLSEHTVRNHIAQILSKLHARNQLEAVIIAARNGLVTIDR